MSKKYETSLAAIVPIYNTEKYMAQCIESLVSQTEPFDEVLLIDDGSWDGSLGICREFQRLSPNIYVYSHENAGVSYTRNMGIERCRSDYILFVDSDDMLDSQAVRCIKEKLCETDYDMVLYDAEIIYEKRFERKGNPYDRSKWISEGEMPGKEFLRKMFPDCYMTVAYTAAYKKRLLLDHHIWFPVGINYAEDTSFIIQALLEAGLVYYNRKKMYIRRYRENSIMTSVIDEKKVRDGFCAAENLAGIILQYMRCGQNAGDQYIALVLFHYNAAVQIGKIYEQDSERKLFSETNAADYAGKFFQFIKNTQYMWGGGNNISNMQMTLRLMGEFKPHQDDTYPMERLLQDTIDEHIVQKLKMLPFGENNITVIIYGTGFAAKTILSLYKEKIGAIRSKLAFMKTEAEIGETYLGLPVYDIKNIPINAQYIVISSYKFRNEMWELLKENNIQTDIIDIYGNEYFEILWRETGGA